VAVTGSLLAAHCVWVVDSLRYLSGLERVFEDAGDLNAKIEGAHIENYTNRCRKIDWRHDFHYKHKTTFIQLVLQRFHHC